MRAASLSGTSTILLRLRRFRPIFRAAAPSTVSQFFWTSLPASPRGMLPPVSSLVFFFFVSLFYFFVFLLLARFLASLERDVSTLAPF